MSTIRTRPLHFRPDARRRVIARGVLSRLACASLAATLSCGGESPTPPSGGGTTQHLALSTHDVTLSTVGDTIALRVTLDGAVVTPSLTIRRETRWLDERSVLDNAVLSAGRLVSAGPGHAIVGVAVGTLSDSVVVNVTPARPLVLSFRVSSGSTRVGSGDTLVVRGYRMDAVVPAQLFSTDVGTMASRDSATLRLALASEPGGSTCSGRASMLTLAPSGVDVTGALPALSRKRAGEIALAPGEAARLTAAEALCLRLAPTAGARYYLAYADTRLVEKAKTGPEWPWPDSVLVSVADRTTGAASIVIPTASVNASRAPNPDLPLVPDRGVAHATMPAYCSQSPSPGLAPFCRGTPYVTGEEFPFAPTANGRVTTTARVLAANATVAAIMPEADSALLSPLGRQRVDTLVAFLNGRGGAFEQGVWETGPTSTSDASGQLLLILESGNANSFALPYWDGAQGSGRWAYADLQLATNSCFLLADECDRDASLGLAVHEATHAYQYLWKNKHAGLGGTSGTLWAVEGGASFAQDMMQFERTGLALDANVDIDAISYPNDPRAGAILLWGELTTSPVATRMARISCATSCNASYTKAARLAMMPCETCSSGRWRVGMESPRTGRAPVRDWSRGCRPGSAPRGIRRTHYSNGR